MWRPGDKVVRRYWTGTKLTTLFEHRVIADDDLGLRLWLPAGTPYWRIRTADGRTQHEAPFDVLASDARLERTLWSGVDAMIWMSDRTDFALWTFWDPATRAMVRRYGNIEAALRRTEHDGARVVDTVDYALDLDFPVDSGWLWKDEDEVAERAGHDGYWPADGVEQIRAFGRQLVDAQRRNTCPFVDEWTVHPGLPRFEVSHDLPPGADLECRVAPLHHRFPAPP